MNILVIDYNMGNVKSVVNAFLVMGYSAIVSNDPRDFEKASHIVLPGVGSFEEGMKNLQKLGLIPLLREEVINKRKPFLGICLGMQLLCDESHEHGTHRGLAWIRAKVERLSDNTRSLRIPHIGWDDIDIVPDNVLCSGLAPSPIFYFVHSYHCVVDTDNIVTAWCDYGGDFAASLQKNNIFATQFHPEKSQLNGLRLLKNFAEYKA